MSFIYTPPVASTPTPPGGADTNVQFNDAGAFGGDANFSFDAGTNTLAFGNFTASSFTPTFQPKALSVGTEVSSFNITGLAYNSLTTATTINITGGSNSFITGHAGAVSLTGGAGLGASSDGGNASLTGGSGFRIGGNANVFAGSAAFGGNADIRAGTGTTGNGAGFLRVGASITAVRWGSSGGNPTFGLYNVTPVLRATVAGAASVFVAGAGVAVQDVSTFDGYTLAQIAKALRNVGVLT